VTMVPHPKPNFGGGCASLRNPCCHRPDTWEQPIGAQAPLSRHGTAAAVPQCPRATLGQGAFCSLAAGACGGARSLCAV
jgi:hypothetical protein